MKSFLIQLYREMTYFQHCFWPMLTFKKKCEFDYSILKKNSQFRGIHTGKRCFILGNGPSVRDVDLKSLENEYVFTVNQAARMPDFPKLKSNYHFWSDPIFFKKLDDDGSKELLAIMKSVNTFENRPIVFFPIEQKAFVEENFLADVLDIRYFKSAIQIYEGFNHVIDYTKITPAYCTVVQWCVSMAIYMGFKEIYLLGCDNTSILVTLKSALKQNDDNDYAYHVSKNEKKRMEKQLEHNSIEAYTESYLKNIRQYRYLYEYCKKRNIALVNCSSTTVLDNVPRRLLEDVLKEK